MKEFYERILVAKYIQEAFADNGKEYTLNECFYYVQAKGDSDTTDMVWLSIAGDYVSWQEHLEDICFKIVGVIRCQPGYSPFTVSQDTLDMDIKFKKWYDETWTPYINSLVKKYDYLWRPRLETKIGRGMIDIVGILDGKIGMASMNNF